MTAATITKTRISAGLYTVHTPSGDYTVKHYDQVEEGCEYHILGWWYADTPCGDSIEAPTLKRVIESIKWIENRKELKKTYKWA